VSASGLDLRQKLSSLLKSLSLALPGNTFVSSLVHAPFSDLVRSVPAGALPHLLGLGAAVGQLRSGIAPRAALVFTVVVVTVKAQCGSHSVTLSLKIRAQASRLPTNGDMPFVNGTQSVRPSNFQLLG
jgi:hypothetical protein